MANLEVHKLILQRNCSKLRLPNYIAIEYTEIESHFCVRGNVQRIQHRMQLRKP